MDVTVSDGSNAEGSASNERLSRIAGSADCGRGVGGTAGNRGEAVAGESLASTHGGLSGIAGSAGGGSTSRDRVACDWTRSAGASVGQGVLSSIAGNTGSSGSSSDGSSGRATGASGGSYGMVACSASLTFSGCSSFARTAAVWSGGKATSAGGSEGVLSEANQQENSDLSSHLRCRGKVHSNRHAAHDPVLDRTRAQGTDY